MNTKQENGVIGDCLSHAPTPLLPNCPPFSAAIPEGFLREASPTTYPAPSFESYLIEGKGIAGGEKLQVSSIGMEEGQGLLPGSRFLQPLGLALLICLMASFSPSHPCLPPLLIVPPLFVSLSVSDFTSVFILLAFFPRLGLFLCLFCSLPSPLSSLFLSVSIFSLSLLSCLYFGVSLCVSVSLLPSSLPISLPYLCLSPQSKKPSLMVPKVSGLYTCPVLYCLSISRRDQRRVLS